MNCPTCRTKMSTVTDDRVYDEIGLPQVVLRNVEHHYCPTCVATATTFWRMEELHRVIAESLARSPYPLTPEQARFLRIHLDETEASLALDLGVLEADVHEWEQPGGVIPVALEGRVRGLVLGDEREGRSAAKKATPASPGFVPRLTLRATESGWTLESSALLPAVAPRPSKATADRRSPSAPRRERSHRGADRDLAHARR